jgi:hypothetical protein
VRSPGSWWKPSAAPWDFSFPFIGNRTPGENEAQVSDGDAATSAAGGSPAGSLPPDNDDGKSDPISLTKSCSGGGEPGTPNQLTAGDNGGRDPTGAIRESWFFHLYGGCFVAGQAQAGPVRNQGFLDPEVWCSCCEQHEMQRVRVLPGSISSPLAASRSLQRVQAVGQANEVQVLKGRLQC